MRTLKTLAIFFTLALGLAAGVARADTSLGPRESCARGGSGLGLQVTYDGTNTNTFLVDDSPQEERLHVVTFFLRLEPDFSMAPFEKHQILRARDPQNGITVWRAHLRRTGAGDYALALWVNDDFGTNFIGEKLVVPGRWQKFTIDWVSGIDRGPGGRASINKGNGRPHVALGLENFFVVGQQQLGGFAGIDPGTTGSICYDGFDSRRVP